MVEKGGGQRERERHTGERNTQARSTWPTHIAPTRFLSLADNRTISLHSLVLSSLPFSTARTLSSPRTLPRRFAPISLSHLPSSPDSLIPPPRRLSHFHVVSRCRPASCTLLPLIYYTCTWYPVASFVRASFSFSPSFSRTLFHTLTPVILRTFSLSVSHTFVSVSSHALLRLPCRFHHRCTLSRFLFSSPKTLPFPRSRSTILRAHVEIRHHILFNEDFVSVRFLFLYLYTVLVCFITRNHGVSKCKKTTSARWY